MKRLVLIVASLALCGAGIAALHAGRASADAPGRPLAAAPTTDGGNPQPARRPATADIAAIHKQVCQDNYAHEIGQLAYLEARLELDAAQRPLFDRWKTVRLDIARRSLADCSTTALPAPATDRPTPADTMAREEETLKHRLADLEAERPVLSVLYNSLNAGQQQALTHPDNLPMGARMVGRRRLAGGGPAQQDAPPGPGTPPQPDR